VRVARGIVPGCVVEYFDREIKRRSEVLAKVNERVPKLVLSSSNGIVLAREDKCVLHSVKIGNSYYGLDGEPIETE
jgi:hypothetical protein